MRLLPQFAADPHTGPIRRHFFTDYPAFAGAGARAAAAVAASAVAAECAVAGVVASAAGGAARFAAGRHHSLFGCPCADGPAPVAAGVSGFAGSASHTFSAAVAASADPARDCRC